MLPIREILGRRQSSPFLLHPAAIKERLSIVSRLEQNLRALDDIGKQNNGNRAFGTSGYAASSDYVLSQITSTNDTDFKTWTQNFNHTYEETRNIKVTGPDGEDVEVLSLMYNNATPLPDGVTGELVAVPVNDTVGK